jgi:hypothetical protein
MASNDSAVTLPQGNEVDVVNVTTADGVVQRQRTTQGDPVDGFASQGVKRDGRALVAATNSEELLLRILLVLERIEAKLP